LYIMLATKIGDMETSLQYEVIDGISYNVLP